MNIIIMDTSNFIDFPIGGQLTSIQNFLKYVKEIEGNLNQFILVGITKSTSDKLGKVKEIVICGVKIKFLPIVYVDGDENKPTQSLRKLYFKSLIKYRKEIKKLNADIFYIHTIEAFLPVYLGRYHKKNVVFSHGNFFSIIDFLRFGNKGYALKIMLSLYIKFILKFADSVFVLDKPTKEQYSKYTKDNNIVLVKNSIDIDYFSNCVKKDSLNDVFNLIFVGRLSKNKGILDIIKSIKKIRNYNVQLNVVGVGEEHDTILNIIRENKLENKVNLLGKKIGAELLSIYSESDILLMNSKTEGTPMVILEALASGIPVVSTPVGNIPNIIKEGFNGELTDGTSENIALKVERIIKNIEEYRTNSLSSSKEYSYKIINKDIHHRLIS